MPQMAPMPWLSLFFFFLSLFLLNMIFNFYINSPKKLNFNSKLSPSNFMKMEWKW
uniref:ATP synthase F0 subunit 8 n=1 Tax=Lysmata vittata TaxID=749979 RepID=A0A7D5TIP4_9EUCA|nr:ATP synthase F0 subunit 8 [Lysmata vittata]QLI42509.1 ATP synthase F0 subunit 8 [Lysmata vittata]QQP21714.1 ATP synthase F0 subunit 8 [Lysmata vittata]